MYPILNLDRYIRIFIYEYADMAQLAEQLICNQQVEGSSPPIGFMDH